MAHNYWCIKPTSMVGGVVPDTSSHNIPVQITKEFTMSKSICAWENNASSKNTQNKVRVAQMETWPTKDGRAEHKLNGARL